jgi:hypothetical protein
VSTTPDVPASGTRRSITAPPAGRFDAALLAGLDEPVRRYFDHAVPNGAPLPAGFRVTMRGRIRLGTWLPFTAEQESYADAFSWRARVATGPLTLFRVTDGFAHGTGRVDARLFGRVPLIGSADENTARSAAARAALEAAAYAPPLLLTHPGVDWEVRGAGTIVARWVVGPERPDVEIRIDEAGAIRSVSAPRWGRQRTPDFQYIPFGGELAGERRFGRYLLPSLVSVGWWWGTPRYAPFFQAELLDVTPLAAPGDDGGW